MRDTPLAAKPFDSRNEPRLEFPDRDSRTTSDPRVRFSPTLETLLQPGRWVVVCIHKDEHGAAWSGFFGRERNTSLQFAGTK